MTAVHREDETGLYRHFFGADMSNKLSLATFGKFLTDMNLEIDRLEFQHYDQEGTVRPP